MAKPALDLRGVCHQLGLLPQQLPEASTSGPISPSRLHHRKEATENMMEMPVLLPSGPPGPPGKLSLLHVQAKCPPIFPEKVGL